jgi:hypothetical protein
MVDVSALRRGAIALTLAWLGCGAPQARTPAATVDAYFAALAHDPIRTLPLLTPAFHQQHGIGVVTAAEAQRLAHREPLPAPDPDAEASIDRLQLGWLAVQSRDAFRTLRDRLVVTPGTVAETGASAVVVVHVEADGAAPFDQRFELVRSAADGSWRIDAVEQRGVVAENRAAAFVAHPNEITRRELARPGRAN